eukprot:1146136-Pleurochrysis_carterae.AAC.1
MSLSRSRYIASLETGYPTPFVYPAYNGYNNLPAWIEKLTPCWGTVTVNDSDNGSLVLTRKTLLIMLRPESWSNAFNGGTFNDETLWTRTDDPPEFYVDTFNAPFIIYTKVVPPGSYTLDNIAAFYLFADAHGLELT